MHYVRYVDKSSIDPRCSNYFIYQCNNCGHEHTYNWQKNFDTVRLRSCPKCNITNDLNDIESLTKRSNQLQEQINLLASELDNVRAKLEIIQITESQMSVKI